MNNPVLKKVIRKFAISVFTVLYAFLALSQATFAWIILQDELMLDNAELGVISESNFYVSIDGENFSHLITNEELSTVLKSRKLNDITSSDGINFYEKDDNIKLKPRDNYISFPLWFKTSEKVNGLFLVDNVTNKINYDVATTENVDGTFVVSKGYNWTADYEFDYGTKNLVQNQNIKPGDIVYCEASNAVRIGIIEADLDEKFGVNKKNNLRTMIFDPTENPEFGFGAKFGAYDYFNRKKGNSLVLPNEFPNTLDSLSYFENPYETNDDSSMCATFQETRDERGTPYYYTKVIVNIWLEGWDADCLDGILYDNVLIQLKFRGSNLTLKNKLKK